jgi:hypothetical protein
VQQDKQIVLERMTDRRDVGGQIKHTPVAPSCPLHKDYPKGLCPLCEGMVERRG